MAHVNPQFNLGALIEKEKLKVDGSNYADWVRSLRIVLRSAKKDYVCNDLVHHKPESLCILC